MSDTNDLRCFTCRQPVEVPPVLNHLEDGRACPTCRDRVLDALPSLLPSSPVDVEVEQYDDEADDRRPRSLVLVDRVDAEGVAELDDPPQPA